MKLMIMDGKDLNIKIIFKKKKLIIWKNVNDALHYHFVFNMNNVSSYLSPPEHSV